MTHASKAIPITGLGCLCAAGGTVEQAKPAEDSGAAPTPEYRRITAEEAKERIDSGREVVILDVRTKEEFDAGHIPGALLLPNETIGTEKPEPLPDLSAEILIYCRSGNRSRQADNPMVAHGDAGE